MDAKTQKNSVFSKALFKQSCKANGTMWGIITFAVCFMLCCVMLISGSGNIGKTKDAIQDTIIQKEVESSFKTRGVNYYALANENLKSFDKIFAEEAGTNYETKVGEYVAAGDSMQAAQQKAAAYVTGTSIQKLIAAIVPRFPPFCKRFLSIFHKTSLVILVSSCSC